MTLCALEILYGQRMALTIHIHDSVIHDSVIRDWHVDIRSGTFRVCF